MHRLKKQNRNLLRQDYVGLQAFGVSYFKESPEGDCSPVDNHDFFKRDFKFFNSQLYRTSIFGQLV